MNLFLFFHYCIICLQCFHSFGLATKERTGRALVVTEQNDEFYLTIPYTYDQETMTAYFRGLQNEKIYLFCEHNNKKPEKFFLKKIKNMKPNTQFTDTNKCAESARAVFVKVKNPGAIKQIYWNEDEMELYHSGYMLQTNLVDRIRKKSTNSKSKPQYEGWDSGYKLFLQIEAYYNIQIQQTAAVKYMLLSTSLFHLNIIFNKNIIDLYGKTNLRKNKPVTFIYTDWSHYLKIFEGVLSEAWITHLDNEKDENGLITALFAPAEHFPIQIWERPALFDFNMIPMWRKPHFMWKRVQNFARVAAKYMGDLKVTAGITGTMTLSNQEVVDKDGFKFPKYLWNIYELQTGQRTYGIIIVLHCNSFEKTDAKLCEHYINCENHGWMVGNEDFRTGEIYCCQMTKNNIAKLNANFLSLKERDIFNLGKWDDWWEKIKEEYSVDVLGQEIDTTDRI